MSFSKPARRGWTGAERQTLDKLLKRGKTAPEIAAVLQRTTTSIYSQIQRLAIKKAGRQLVRLGLRAKK
jgi:predicted transcriptional regulator